MFVLVLSCQNYDHLWQQMISASLWNELLMRYCSPFEFSFAFVSIICWRKFLYFFTNVSPTQPCCNSPPLHTALQVSSFPSSWSCFYEAMTLLLQRCAAGHCHPEWWNSSLGVFQQDPEGFGATRLLFRALFQTRVKILDPAEANFQTEEGGRFTFNAFRARGLPQQKRERIHFKGIPIQLQLIKFQSKVLRLCWYL